MSNRSAFEILGVIARGFDPQTGDPLGDESLWRRADVASALAEGVAALDHSARRTARGFDCANRGLAWAAEDEQRLLAAFEAHTPFVEIARLLGRSVAGIEARLEKLGRLSSAERSTRNRYASGADDPTKR